MALVAVTKISDKLPELLRQVQECLKGAVKSHTTASCQWEVDAICQGYDRQPPPRVFVAKDANYLEVCQGCFCFRRLSLLASFATDAFHRRVKEPLVDGAYGVGKFKLSTAYHG